MKTLKLVVAAGVLALVTGGSTAQDLQDCAKDGSCVEFTVRYMRNASEPAKRLQIVDSQTKKPLDYYGKGACQIGKSCTVSGNLVDITEITLMQTFNPHYCYRVCSGGWCYTKCPAH
jgi:hypothetical protein